MVEEFGASSGHSAQRVPDFYAGRFPIGIGQDCQVREGVYFVRNKQHGPVYPQGDLPVHSTVNSSNPLGEYLIELDNQLSIHGTSDPRNVGSTGGTGSICMGDEDIKDVFDILTVNSRVRVLR